MQGKTAMFLKMLAAIMLLALTVLGTAGPTHARTNSSATTAPAPTVSLLNPTSALAGGAGFTLTVTGTNFLSASVVYFGEQPLATTFVSATQLTAAVPAQALARPRVVSVVVGNGRRGGGTSSAVSFTVTPSSPAPTVSLLSPASALAGSAATTLTVTGTNFLSSSVVYFGRSALTPTAVTATQITVTVPASALARPDHVPVVVSNGPSSGYSAPTIFTVTPPAAPTVTSLSSTTAVAGGAGFTLTVTGTNFLSASVVYFGEQPLATTFVSATQLTAAVPAQALARPRVVAVVVSNGRSSGYSAPETFTVSPPTAQVAYLIARRSGSSNAGLAVAYQASATGDLDLTQPVSLTLDTTVLPAVQIYQTGPLTLTAKTFRNNSGTSVTYYEYQSATLFVTVVPQANNQYAVQLETIGVNLSAINTTQPVLVSLTLGGQAFSATAQPTVLHD